MDPIAANSLGGHDAIDSSCSILWAANSPDEEHLDARGHVLVGWIAYAGSEIVRRCGGLWLCVRWYVRW